MKGYILFPFFIPNSTPNPICRPQRGRRRRRRCLPSLHWLSPPSHRFAAQAIVVPPMGCCAIHAPVMPLCFSFRTLRLPPQTARANPILQLAAITRFVFFLFSYLFSLLIKVNILFGLIKTQ